MKTNNNKKSLWKIIVFIVSALICEIFCVAAVLPYFAIKFQDTDIISTAVEYLPHLIPNLNINHADLFRYVQIISFGIAAVCFGIAIIDFVLFAVTVARGKKKDYSVAEDFSHLDSFRTLSLYDENDSEQETSGCFVIEKAITYIHTDELIF